MSWQAGRPWEPSRARFFLLVSTPPRHSCGDTLDTWSSLVGRSSSMSWLSFLDPGPQSADSIARQLACPVASSPTGIKLSSMRCADTLLDNLTVYEMLAYTAELKNPMSEPFERKRAKVEMVIQQLGLNGCRGVRIGNPLARGISGACSGPLSQSWILFMASWATHVTASCVLSQQSGCSWPRRQQSVCPSDPLIVWCRWSVQARQHWHCPGDQPSCAVPG